jgi:hypothetical protein
MGQILLIIAVVLGILVIGEMRVHDAAAALDGKAGRWTTSSHIVASGESIVFLLDTATGSSWRFDGGLTWHPLERR